MSYIHPHVGENGTKRGRSNANWKSWKKKRKRDEGMKSTDFMVNYLEYLMYDKGVSRTTQQLVLKYTSFCELESCLSDQGEIVELNKIF